MDDKKVEVREPSWAMFWILFVMLVVVFTAFAGIVFAFHEVMKLFGF